MSKSITCFCFVGEIGDASIVGASIQNRSARAGRVRRLTRARASLSVNTVARDRAH